MDGHGVLGVARLVFGSTGRLEPRPLYVLRCACGGYGHRRVGLDSTRSSLSRRMSFVVSQPNNNVIDGTTASEHRPCTLASDGRRSSGFGRSFTAGVARLAADHR